MEAKNQYQKIYLGITAFISAVQLVTIGTLLVTTVPIQYSERILSVEGRLAVAPNSNVIVLLLDSVYNTQFEETMTIHPEIAESLKDFTYYDNADCHYFYTYPSLSHMLTGYPYDSTITQEEHSLQYECDLYTAQLSYVAGSPEAVEGIYDNISEMVPHYTGYGTSIHDWHEGDQRIRELWYPTNRDKENVNGFWVYTYGNR